MSIKQQRRRITQNVRRVVHQTIPRKVERALTAIGIVVGNTALQFTPVEFSTLVNSQDRLVQQTARGARVSIVYTQNYAAALHERTDWKPRPPDQKSGPAWNPAARPGFLTHADKLTRAQQRQIIRGELHL